MTGLDLNDKMPYGVSVVICCHNSEKRLPATLSYLAKQVIPSGLPWEIIVVDNGSTDRTSAIPHLVWPTEIQALLRVVAEPIAGLNQARLRGIQEAQYGVVSLIDDDNWVAMDWVARVATIFAAHRQVGACGGRSVAVGEKDLPAWFKRVEGFYAVGQQSSVDGDIADTQGTLLWGAGLNLRTAAFRALLNQGFQFFVQDRKGAQLSSGGDTEICFALRAQGWRIWYDDALALQHFIPKERLHWNYALRLVRGMGQASVLFLIYHTALRLAPFDHYPGWKSTWPFQFLKAVREFVGCFLANPWQCATEKEGASAVIQFQVFQGRLSMLVAIRHRYRLLKQTIKNAKWASRC